MIPGAPGGGMCLHDPQLPPQLCGFSAHTETSPHVSSTLSPLWLWCPVTLSLVSFSPLQSANIPDALCEEDTDCQEGKAVVAGNGEGSVPVCAVSGVLQRPQAGYIPQISDYREHQGLSFLSSLLLRSLPCLQLCWWLGQGTPGCPEAQQEGVCSS